MASGTSATYTTVGLNLIAGAQIGGPSAQVTYVAIGTGTGTLSGGLTAGQAYTQLGVNALAAAVPGNQVLAIVYQTSIDFVTVAPSGAPQGATSLPIVSWTPAFSFPAGTGLVNQPSLGDTQLQAEAYRTAVSAATPGSGAGETLISGYGDPTATPSGTYVEVGWFADPSPTPVTNSGTLIARAVIWWPHAQYADSQTFQMDGVI